MTFRAAQQRDGREHDMKKAMITLAFVMTIATLFGQQTHWTKADGFENNMNMSAVLYVNGTVQHLGQVEIGAFCGDECREAMLPYEIDGEMVYLMTVSGNTGDVITFRLWDHQTDSELDYECQTTYTFVANDVVGEYPEWYPIHFTSSVASFQITASTNPQEGGAVAGAGTYDSGATVTLTATASEGYAFVNWTENDEVVSTEATYSFTVTGDRTLMANFEATTPPTPPTPPATHELVITLKPGWNWISYLLTVEMPLEEAFESLTPNHGDMIKGQGSNCSYDASTGQWVGTLVKLTPGQGYIYLNTASQAKSFSYPER